MSRGNHFERQYSLKAQGDRIAWLEAIAQREAAEWHGTDGLPDETHASHILIEIHEAVAVTVHKPKTLWREKKEDTQTHRHTDKQAAQQMRLL